MKFDSKKGTAEAQIPIPEPSDVEKCLHLNFEDQEIECKKLEKELERVDKAKDNRGNELSCRDGSDLYRPIIVKAEETGGQPSQPDNNEQSGENVKAEELTTVWKTEPVEEWEYNQKGEEEKAKYRPDSSTGLWMVAVTEETCNAVDGFVCKVRLREGFNNPSHRNFP